jgi:hypothetical protein
LGVLRTEQQNVPRTRERVVSTVEKTAFLPHFGDREGSGMDKPGPSRGLKQAGGAHLEDGRTQAKGLRKWEVGLCSLKLTRSRMCEK